MAPPELMSGVYPTRAGVTTGQKVLITGASGGVGLAAVQLAALRCARVWGVTSPAKADVVKSRGAAAAYDRDAACPPTISMW